MPAPEERGGRTPLVGRTRAPPPGSVLPLADGVEPAPGERFGAPPGVAGGTGSGRGDGRAGPVAGRGLDVTGAGVVPGRITGTGVGSEPGPAGGGVT